MALGSPLVGLLAGILAVVKGSRSPAIAGIVANVLMLGVVAMLIA
jgi:hypothetical protein